MSDAALEPLPNISVVQEELRIASLRTFAVKLDSGGTDYVCAHYHNGGQDGPGHLSFVTVDVNGRSLIGSVYNASEWLSLVDVTTPERMARAAELSAQQNAMNKVVVPARKAKTLEEAVMKAPATRKKKAYGVH